VISNLDLEWAWFAGLFEGEGCISLVSRNSVNLRINMTDRDVLERVQSLVGGTIVSIPKEAPQHKPRWVWQVTREDVVRPALARLKPYLMERRGARLAEAERRLAQVRRHGFCQKGLHPLSGENRLASPTGVRCRECNRQRDRERAGGHRHK